MNAGVNGLPYRLLKFLHSKLKRSPPVETFLNLTQRRLDTFFVHVTMYSTSTWSGTEPEVPMRIEAAVEE